MKDQPMSLDTGEGHQKDVDDIQRIVNPIPEGTEEWRRRMNERGDQKGLGERQRNEHEQKRDDQQKENDMMMLRSTKLTLRTKLREDVEKTRKRKKLENKKNTELQMIRIHHWGVCTDNEPSTLFLRLEPTLTVSATLSFAENG